MDDAVRAFLEANHGAIMTHLEEGRHASRGPGWSRSRRWKVVELRNPEEGANGPCQKRSQGDPVRPGRRQPVGVAGLETTVTILEGPGAVDQNLALYRTLAGEPEDLDEYRRTMAAEERLVYEFAIHKAYGMY